MRHFKKLIHTNYGDALLVVAVLGVVSTSMISLVLVQESGFVFSIPGTVSETTLSRAADAIVAKCRTEQYPLRCYDHEIPLLMDTGISMEQAFTVTKFVQQQDQSYYYCHVLGHNLSEKETAKDPSKWAEVVGRCPVGMCSNGCLHGAFQERYRDQVMNESQITAIVPQLRTICESNHERNFTGLEQASCYHALGHLAMYITGADAKIATGVCDNVAKQGTTDFSQLCYEGAFMQIFQPLEPEDFTLVQNIPATTTVLAESFCDTYSGNERAACHRESWPLYLASIKTPAGLQSFCALTPGAENMERCYNAMFYVLTAQFNFDQTKIVALCNGLPKEREAQCFANAASRHVETDYRLADRAVALCKIADTEGVGERCYTELLFYSSYNFAPGSASFTAMCTAFPEPCPV